MNASFREVAARYRQVLDLSHVQRVTRLYRKSLRTLDSWAVDRELFNREADKIRARFDGQRSADAGLAARLLREAEAELATWTHPDPYVVPYMPGGSKFMRNPPPPLSLVFPAGVPPEYNIAAQSVHYVQVPLSAAGPGGMATVLVDPATKSSA